MLSINYVNDPRIISQQTKMTAINSCIEIDITGQISSDSLGCKMYSGFGGQLDFTRGAAMGQDGRGKAIIAFPSTTSKGESKIQPVLKLGMNFNILHHSLLLISINYLKTPLSINIIIFLIRWWRCNNQSPRTLHSYRTRSSTAFW